jgi:hypothetical protein
MTENRTRKSFRDVVFKRDNYTCIVPWCNQTAQDSHHIVERALWNDGGYIPDNGASVCETHHRAAEDNTIPPQAFWRWAGITEPPLPDGIEDIHVNKWGDALESPPWKEHRKTIKYPSTRHLPWSHGRDTDDTAHTEVEWALNVPLVATLKMDGGNACLLKDTDEPVRARNGRQADKDHFDMAKQMYWEEDLYSDIPEHLQIFGEWLYAKHSIHYGCNCDEPCEDIGPALRDYFQVFGVYDVRFDIWLGWEETVAIADALGLTVAPPATDSYHVGSFDNVQEFWDFFYELSQEVVAQGHEGIVVRSAYPFHYGQIGERLGKYVREGHVKDDETHWSNRPLVRNELE